MRTLSRKFFAIGLLLALLVCSTGRAVPVSALAQPDPFINAEFAPVYDTQIYQLEDFMRENLTPAQGDVFWIMMGLYVAAQGGMSDYKLSDPYATQDGILNWLKSCGIQIYNSLIGMNAIGIDPITGVDYRPYLKGLSDVAMGMAVKASTYTDTTDFVSDVEVQQKYFVPFMPDVQTSLNYVFSQANGLYNWQFENSDFTSNFDFPTSVIPPNSNYWDLLLSFHLPIVRAKYYGVTNCVMNSSFFDTYRNLWFDTQNSTLYFCDDYGNFVNSDSTSIDIRLLEYRNNLGQVETFSSNVYPKHSFSLVNDSWQATVQYVIDNPLDFLGYNYAINDFVLHYYYGVSWDNKHEIFNTTDLNFDENTLPYFNQVTNNNLLDIKGILQDLLNTTNLWDVFINNLYDLDGVIVTDPQLIRVTTQILEEIQTQNVPLPVNLNDIADFTDNSYMDRVKEEAKRGGNALAALVAFWHNCDAELIYVLFGAGITVLVGAFIGKWGHS